MTDELAQIKATMQTAYHDVDYLLDVAESLVAENRRLLAQRCEYAAVIARQRQTIDRQAKLIGITPTSQLHLHGDPLMRGVVEGSKLALAALQRGERQ